MAQITFANRGQAAGGGQDPVTAALIAQLLKRSGEAGNIRTIAGGLANTASKLLDARTAKKLQNKQLAAALAQRQQFGQAVGGALPAAPQATLGTPATPDADIGDAASIQGVPGAPAGPDRFAIARALAQSVAQTGNPQAQRLLGAILPNILDPSKSPEFAARMAAAKRVPVSEVAARAAAGREPIPDAARRAAATRAPSTATTTIGDPTSATGTRVIPSSLITSGKIRPEDLAQFPPGPPKSGLTVETRPDGTIKLTTGAGAGSGSGTGLQKSTLGKLEQSIIQGQDSLARLQSISENFDPRFLQASFRFDAAKLAFKEKAGFNISPDDREFLSSYTEFARSSTEQLNLYIKQITGAQMSEQEAERLTRAVPNPGKDGFFGILSGDSPTQFQSKLAGVTKQLRLAQARAKHVLRNGLTKSGKPWQSGISLPRMERIMDDRIIEVLGGLPEGLSPEERRARVAPIMAQEFGLTI